jgi:hypothetical protein
MILSHNFGPDNLYGIEVSFPPTAIDELDMAINSWELIGAKAMVKIQNFQLILLSLEISDSRASLGALNCFLTVFWG